MHHSGIEHFLSHGKAALAKGPVAVIMAEDAVELGSTIRHHLGAGFRAVLLLAHPEVALDPALEAQIHRIDHDVHADAALVGAMNRLIPEAPGTWFYYGYNAEYLFHPFCETRSVGEMLAFHAEERREAVLCYVVDLYADDLSLFPNAVSLERAHLDRSGYYALGRPDPANHNHPKERQLDFFGGLRWRFEEHIPAERRKIDRIALFRAGPGLVLRDDYTFSDEEMNTYACAWHHNMTAAVASFRTAKALKTNAGSKGEIASFTWHNSVRFEWHSQQLFDLGLMEPGQWF